MSLVGTYPDINPAARNNKAFMLACLNGHTDIAKYIMSLSEKYSDIKPAEKDNHAFHLACENNHTFMIQYLLTLTDVRLAISNNENDMHKKILQKWIRSYVKNTIMIGMFLETWRLESVYRLCLV